MYWLLSFINIIMPSHYVFVVGWTLNYLCIVLCLVYDFFYNK